MSEEGSEEEGEENDDVDKNLDNEEYIKGRVSNKPRHAVSDVSYGKKNEYKDVKIRIKEYDGNEKLNILKSSLRKSPVFYGVDNETFEDLVKCMDFKLYPEGTVILSQGELYDRLFFLYKGEIECKMQFDKPQENNKPSSKYDPRVVHIYTDGDYFGEQGVMYNAISRGTFTCVKECQMYLLRRDKFKQMVVKKNKDENNLLLENLRQIPLFSVFDNKELERFCLMMKEAVYMKGETIANKGAVGDIFYYISKGKCAATEGREGGAEGKIIGVYNPGDSFNENFLLRWGKWENNIEAKSDIVILKCIERREFKKLMGNLEEMLMRNMDVYYTYFPEEKPQEEPKPPVPEKKEEVRNSEVKESAQVLSNQIKGAFEEFNKVEEKNKEIIAAIEALKKDNQQPDPNNAAQDKNASAAAEKQGEKKEEENPKISTENDPPKIEPKLEEKEGDTNIKIGPGDKVEKKEGELLEDMIVGSVEKPENDDKLENEVH